MAAQLNSTSSSAQYTEEWFSAFVLQIIITYRKILEPADSIAATSYILAINHQIS